MPTIRDFPVFGYSLRRSSVPSGERFSTRVMARASERTSPLRIFSRRSPGSLKSIECRASDERIDHGPGHVAIAALVAMAGGFDVFDSDQRRRTERAVIDR